MMTDHESSKQETQPAELAVTHDGSMLRLSLTRPHHRNALSRSLVAALSSAFSNVVASNDTRVIVLTGEGPVFCAGADLREFVEVTDESQVRADGEALATLLDRMVSCPVPIVAAVHGAAFGGAIGLICAADYAIAAAGTRFSLSEARLGLVAATIGPYLVDALGPREAKARMLLAAPFETEEALRIGLIHRVCPPDELTATVQETTRLLLQSPPGALTASKRLVRQIQTEPPESIRQFTIDLLAERRASDEGQEGMAAFLAKRAPRWVPPKEER